MKKTTAGTTAPVAKKRSATKAGDRGKAKSAAPVAKRKKNSAAGAGKMTQIMKKAALITGVTGQVGDCLAGRDELVKLRRHRACRYRE